MMPVALSTPATPLTVSSSPAGTVAAAAPETEPAAVPGRLSSERTETEMSVSDP